MLVERVVERRGAVREQPEKVRCEHERAGRDGDPGRRRAEIAAPARIGERGEREPRQQHDRPIFAEHRRSRRHARERRGDAVALLERSQEEQRRRRPQRDQHGVGVELQRVEIVERNQGEQREARGTLLAVEPARG